MKKTAVLQSNYIPWKGYFDLIASVDEFIIYDDAQYTRNTWRNRNQIKTPQGLVWCTVPVRLTGRFAQSIRETEIADSAWAQKHIKSFRQYYSRTPFFEEVMHWLEPIYAEAYTHLSLLNRNLITAVCAYLGIKTRISCSWDYALEGDRVERLISLCRQTGAGEYVSGPAAQAYIDEQLFQEAGIKLTWFDYSGYPPYPQLYGPFVHEVSILDLLFNCGKDAATYMKMGALPA